MAPPSKTKSVPCKSCPALVRPSSATGYCARCVKRSPEYRQKVSAGTHRRYADPAARERTGQAVRLANALDPSIRERKAAAMREIASDPEWQARNAEQCRDRRLWERGVAARTPESDARAGRTFSKRHGLGAWCPADYIAMARDLRRSNVPLDEVKRLVAEQGERDLQRIRAKLGAR